MGRNGSGKSNFLNALRLFYDGSPRLTEDDFHNRDITQDIEIEVTFGDLNDDALHRFANYIEGDVVKVVRVFSGRQPNRSGTYHGSKLQNPDFVAIREAGAAMDVRRAYSEIRTTNEYSALRPANSLAAVMEALDQWEIDNPSQLERIRETDQFFGFTGVGQGYLGRFNRFIHIPAVRDASEDANEGRGSSVTEIMNLVVRNVLTERREFVEFQERIANEFKEITDRNNLPELASLQSTLTGTLHSYVPNADVILDWIETEDLQVPLPRAQVRLSEDGFSAAVDKTGHGLQRAFILTMLQHLAAAQRIAETDDEPSSQSEDGSSASDVALPSLVLAIEEPELYQHPSRQRHFANVLLQLASGAIAGVAIRTQVIYTTHSPLFVGLDRFEQIRVIRKLEHEPRQPKVSKTNRTDLDSVAFGLWESTGSQGPQFTAEGLVPRLQAIMTPWMNEGFFADVAVLVEGEDDRAAILGTAMAMGFDFDAIGIAVIPCDGKNNLDRPTLIFRDLGIPVYVIWDGDHAKQSNPEANERLMAINDRLPEQWPQGIWETSACFKNDLETTIKDEIGDETYNRLFSQAKSELGFNESDSTTKNPHVFGRFIELTTSEGNNSATLAEIVNAIVALR